MANDTQDKASDRFTITNTKVIGLLAAALIFVTTYIVTSVVNSPHRRIDKLVEGLEELGISDRLTIMELTMGHVQDNDKECKSRQEALVKELNHLTSTVTNYQAETKRRDTSQEKMIDRCLEDLRWRTQ